MPKWRPHVRVHITRRSRDGQRVDMALVQPGASDLIASLDVGDRNANRSWDGVPDSIPLVRRWMDDLLGHRHPAREAVRLLVTEIATNAIRHTRSGDDGGRIHVSASISNQRIRVNIRDDGAETVPVICSPGSRATGGRGLALVSFIADRWGHDPETSTVWFEVEQR